MPGDPVVQSTRLYHILENVRIGDLETDVLCGLVYDALASASTNEELQAQLLDLLPLDSIEIVESLLSGRREIVGEYATRVFGLDQLDMESMSSEVQSPGSHAFATEIPGPVQTGSQGARATALLESGGTVQLRDYSYRDLDGEPAGPLIFPFPSQTVVGPPVAQDSVHGNTERTTPSDSLRDQYAEAVSFLASALHVSNQTAVQFLRRGDWDVDAAINIYMWHQREQRHRARAALGLESDESDGGDEGEEREGREGHGPGHREGQRIREGPREPYLVHGASATRLIDEVEVDLHGYRMEEAERKVRALVNEAVEQIASRRAPERCAVQITLITGRGVHSAGHPTIRRLVWDLLEQNRIRHWEVEGTRGGAVRLVVSAETPML